MMFAGNEPNLLLHAYEYQVERVKMYEELYKQQVEKSKKTRPVIIE